MSDTKLRECRCEVCKKLFFLEKIVKGELEIACTRCGTMNRLKWRSLPEIKALQGKGGEK